MLLSKIEDIITRRGAESYLGEEVSMEEHMLQAAMLAESQDGSDEAIAAALLHDLGHYSGEFPEDAFDKLRGLDLWIVDCVRYEPHYSHSHFDQTMDWIRQLKPKKAILTHMGHWLDYKELKSKCPVNVEPGFDGMVINV